MNKRIKRLLETAARGGLTEDEQMTLMYMVHDKEHIGAHKSRDPHLDKALKLFPSTSTKNLYRGIMKGELNAIKDGVYAPHAYVSFSERKETALGFMAGYESATLIILKPGARGFNYGAWGAKKFKELKKTDREAYDESDGGYMIETFEEEAEWFFPFESKFKVIGAPIVAQGRTTIWVKQS